MQRFFKKSDAKYSTLGDEKKGVDVSVDTPTDEKELGVFIKQVFNLIACVDKQVVTHAAFQTVLERKASKEKFGVDFCALIGRSVGDIKPKDLPALGEELSALHNFLLYKRSCKIDTAPSLSDYETRCKIFLNQVKQVLLENEFLDARSKCCDLIAAINIGKFKVEDKNKARLIKDLENLVALIEGLDVCQHGYLPPVDKNMMTVKL